MKTLSIQLAAALVALATLATDAPAQVPAGVTQVRPLYNVQSSYGYGLRPHYVAPYPHGYWRGAATVAGSYARGLAALTYAQGQYNVLTAEARAIHAEARAREIENHELATQTYFAMRQTNREARAAERGPRASAAEIARRAEQAAPDRLSSSQLGADTGKVSWPALLQADQFAAFRAELEKTFSERAANGRITAEGREQTQQTANALLAELKRYVRQVPPSDYIEARRFIESLSHEAQLPVI